MSKFQPINKHVEVEPIEVQGFIASAGTFEEKGKIISVAQDCTWFDGGDIGKVVYFDSWTAAKFPDADGKIRYLVQEENIRAYESLSE